MHFPLHLQKIEFAEGVIELFVPDEATVKQAYEKGQIAFPYWSRLWPAAHALAAFLFANPGYTSNKKILEMGAGLGLPSLVAAQTASSVLCTDYSTEAIQVAAKSAAHEQRTNFQTAVIDWHNPPNELQADVLLLSDINYEPTAFQALLTLIEKFLRKNATVLLSTPQRLMAKDFIQPLLRYCTIQEEQTVTQAGGEVAITVLVLQEN